MTEHVRDIVGTQEPPTEAEKDHAPNFLQKWQKRRMLCPVCSSSRWESLTNEDPADWVRATCIHCGYTMQFLKRVEKDWDGGWSTW